jgi:hypothetical protein
VKRSLYSRAVGYNYEATKIFMPANREKPVIVPYIEHTPPDVLLSGNFGENSDIVLTGFGIIPPKCRKQ